MTSKPRSPRCGRLCGENGGSRRAARPLRASVEHDRARGQLGDRGRDVREAPRVVSAVAADEAPAPAVLVGEHVVAESRMYPRATRYMEAGRRRRIELQCVPRETAGDEGTTSGKVEAEQVPKVRAA